LPRAGTRQQFPLAETLPAVDRANPLAEKEGVAGYEISLNYNGVPCRLIPRAASEMKNKSRFQLLSVNEAEIPQESMPPVWSSNAATSWALAP